MSPIASIGAALAYDAEESLLAAGGSLASVLALAAARAALRPVDDEEALSLAGTVLAVSTKTVKPSKS